jgi:hypothetical protein
MGSRAGFIVVFDGAYASGELVQSLMAQGVVVVTRLRRDAKLFDVPENVSGKRGRPRIYGKNRIDLSKVASQSKNWLSISYACRGVKVEGRYQTFLATSRIARGVIRVVMVEHSNGNRVAYISTDATMSVETILKAVSDRWAIEEQFHDVKEVWGAGQQQVRSVWSSIGCWNLCGWMYSLVELACWDRTHEQLVDRSDRPWDNVLRRPSHSDRRRQIRREMLRNELFRRSSSGHRHGKNQQAF